MALALYRRHRRECKALRTHNSRTSEYEERKKGWKRCDCPIFVSGTLQKTFKRQSTGEWEWAAAALAARAKEAEGFWTDLVLVPQASAAEERVGPVRTTIEEAIESFLAKCLTRAIKPSTFAKYKTFTRQFLSFVNGRGYVHVDQLSTMDMDQFYESWTDGIQGRAKKLERLKSFVKFCLKRKWIAEDIASDLEPPPGSSLINPKAPFTDEELDRLQSACDAVNQGRRNWTGEDARDFIYLSLYTGLRISDVATFDIAKRLTGNNVFLRTHKTGQPLSTYIPTWLVERLKARERQHGTLIFKCGVTLNAKQLCDIWRNKRLSLIFKLAGPWEEKPHHHRFRHTFVRILLEKGVSVSDVAELIGDTPEIVLKHYSRFVKTRQDRLTRILEEAFADQSAPRRLSASSDSGAG